MICNQKFLGLALIAVFAMCAIISSSAFAEQGELTSSGPVTLTGKDKTGTKTSLTAFGETTQCETTYTGHKYSVTPHTFVPARATTITITPTYKNCTTKGLPTTVTMNGCDYVLHIGETVEPLETGRYEIKADVICPAGKVIEFHVYLSGAHSSIACTIKVKEQTELSAGTLQNIAGEKAELVGPIAGTHAEKEGLCGKETTTSAQVDLLVEFEGRNEKGEATGISISDP